MQVAGTAAALLWQRGHLAQRTAIACGHSAALHSPPSPAALAARLPPDLPQPLDFEVKQAVFIKSSSETKELPTPVTPEFAFIGQTRSGKSSVVQLLTGNPNLKTIATNRPGRAQTLHHFLINRKWMLVDCPGYGPGGSVQGWSEFTQEYFLSRRSLAHIFLTIDASSHLSIEDINAAQWVNDTGRAWSLVFTKVDASQPDQPAAEENIAECVQTMERLLGRCPPYVPTSAVTGLGRDALLQYIASLRQGFRMPMVFK